MRRGLVACAVAVAMPMPAMAETSLYERLYAPVPDAHYLTLSEQLTEQLTILGNTVGQHLDTLSYDFVALKFDGRRRRAHVRVGGGNERYLTFRIASDVEFAAGAARINARIDLAVAGRSLQLKLPEVEMVPTSYRGEKGVEIRVPIFKRTW